MRIKICGITREKDVVFCDSLGVDFLGFINVKESPRFVDVEKLTKLCKIKTTAKKVVVVMNPVSLDLEDFSSFDFIQFHGFESKDIIARAKERGFGVIKTIFPELPESIELCREVAGLVDFFLVDSASKLKGKGGYFDEEGLIKVVSNGKIFNRDFFISGGINVENVGSYIKMLRPYGVDVSSGVEERPGIKSKEKVASFVESVRFYSRK